MWFLLLCFSPLLSPIPQLKKHSCNSEMSIQFFHVLSKMNLKIFEKARVMSESLPSSSRVTSPMIFNSRKMIESLRSCSSKRRYFVRTVSPYICWRIIVLNLLMVSYMILDLPIWQTLDLHLFTCYNTKN